MGTNLEEAFEKPKCYNKIISEKTQKPLPEQEFELIKDLSKAESKEDGILESFIK